MNKDVFEVAMANIICPFCAKKNESVILFNQKLTEGYAKRIKKFHNQAIGFSEEPCDECKGHMSKGFLLIGIIEEKSDFKNIPEGFYRSGHIVVIKKDCEVAEILYKINPSCKDKGFVFIDIKSLKRFGLIEEDNNILNS